MPTEDEELLAEKMRRRNAMRRLNYSASQGLSHPTESPVTPNYSQSPFTVSQSPAEPSQQPPNSSGPSSMRPQHNRNRSVGTQLALELQELNVQSQVGSGAPEIPRNTSRMLHSIASRIQRMTFFCRNYSTKLHRS
jgi:hypothetical protein